MNKEKSLSTLKEKIDGTTCVAMDVSQFDIESKTEELLH